MRERVGILGGSFDPVHRGHLEIARAAREALELRHVWLVPCSVPPHKPGRRLAPSYDRLEMLYLAIEGRPGLEVATDELARGGVCYTIDTLRALRARGVEPVFLLGSDALADMPSWRETDALRREFDFGVVRRAATGSDGVPDPTALAGGRVVPIPMPVDPVSSSAIRALAAEGRPLHDLVPGRVARYIQSRRLFRREASR